MENTLADDIKDTSSLPSINEATAKKSSNKRSHKCLFCQKQFTLRTNLSRHNRKFHPELIAKQRNKNLKCPDKKCSEVFASRKRLRGHIEEVHGIKLESEQKMFSSFEEFRLWKVNIEKEMTCSYVSSHGPKILASKDTSYHYSCFRSGSFTSKSSGKRALKSLGSRKINGCCPSSMDVTVLKKGVFMEFWKTHFGHEVDMCHLSLSADERREIADKLRQGVKYDRILDEIRDNVTTEVRRIHFLKRKDLHNISRTTTAENRHSALLAKMESMLQALRDKGPNFDRDSYSELNDLLDNCISIINRPKVKDNCQLTK